MKFSIQSVLFGFIELFIQINKDPFDFSWF